MRRRDFIKVVAGSGAGVALYFAYPNRVQLVAGEGRSYLLSLNAPAGTVTTEVNAAYKATVASAPRAETAPAAAAGDWPSCNKTLTTERFSDLPRN